MVVRNQLLTPLTVTALMMTASLAAILVPTAEPTVAAELSPAKRKELKKLLADFRKLSEQNARLQTMEKIFALEGSAPKELMGVIGKELQPQVSEYRNKFYRAAAREGFEKARRANLQEVNSLRSQVLDLLDLNNLTKEQIVRQADPAMEKLNELLVVERASIFEKSPELITHRMRLMELGQLWEKCAARLAEQADTNQVPAGQLKQQQDSQQPPSFEEYLQDEEEMAARLAVPMPASAKAVLGANSRLAKQLGSEEARGVLALNLTRNLLGLPPVAIDLALTGCARDHSHDMETKNFFDHTSPVPGKTSVKDRARRFGTKATAENIALGPTDGYKVNQMWFHSPGHMRNMLGKHRRVGLGRSGIYWTQVFGR